MKELMTVKELADVLGVDDETIKNYIRKFSPNKMRYMIKGVDKDLRGYGRFQYPESGFVEAPDWNDKPECKGGLFGIDEEYPWHNIKNDKYIIIAYDHNNRVIVENEKIKIKNGDVVLVSDKILDIQKWLNDRDIIYCGYGCVINAGDSATIKAGDSATIDAGYSATIKAGYYATIDAGYSATIKAGDSATIKAGDSATIDAGYSATIKAGDYATIDAGDFATIKAGDYATIKIYGNKVTIIEAKESVLIFQYYGKLYVKKLANVKNTIFELINGKIKSEKLEK